MLFKQRIVAGTSQRKFAYLPVVVGHTADDPEQRVSVWWEEYEEMIEFINPGLILDGLTGAWVHRRAVRKIENVEQYRVQEMLPVL